MSYNGPALIKDVWRDSNIESESRKKKKTQKTPPVSNNSQEILIGSKKYRPRFIPPPQQPAPQMPDEDEETALMDEMVSPEFIQSQVPPSISAALQQQEMLAGINDEDDYADYQTINDNWTQVQQPPQQPPRPPLPMESRSDLLRNIKSRGGNYSREGFRGSQSDEDILTVIADRINELIDSIANGGGPGKSRNPTIDVILYIFTGIFIIYIMNTFVKLGGK